MNFMKCSFSYSGAVLWNSLPVELRQADLLMADLHSTSFADDCCMQFLERPGFFCSHLGQIVYNFHCIKLPVAMIVIGF